MIIFSIQMCFIEKKFIQEPLLIEAFGNCLPSNKTGKNFINKILEQKAPSQLLVSD